MAVTLMNRIWAASVRAQLVETRLEAQLLLLEDFYLLCWLGLAFVCAERVVRAVSDGHSRNASGTGAAMLTVNSFSARPHNWFLSARQQPARPSFPPRILRMR